MLRLQRVRTPNGITARHLRDERSLLGRVLSRRPHDVIGAAVAALAVVAIVINALFMQAGPHPAPIFSVRPRPVVAETTSNVVPVLPRPRPADAKNDPPAATRTRAQIVADIQKELSRRGFYDGPIDGTYGAKMDAAIRDFGEASGVRLSGEPNETLLAAITKSSVKATPASATLRRDPIAELLAPSKQILAVQRALADYGYGQVQPTGVFDPATRAAIEKFERDRRMPVTGQVSDRLTRELAAMTGRPLE